MAGGGIKINNIKVSGGADGATFTPSVDNEGNLSWSNDKGYTNPATVNIKGRDGADGQDGKTGAKLVSQILQGQDANGGNIYKQTFDDGTTAYFTAPKGDKGDKGESVLLEFDEDSSSFTNANQTIRLNFENHIDGNIDLQRYNNDWESVLQIGEDNEVNFFNRDGEKYFEIADDGIYHKGENLKQWKNYIVEEGGSVYLYNSNKTSRVAITNDNEFLVQRYNPEFREWMFELYQERGSFKLFNYNSYDHFFEVNEAGLYFLNEYYEFFMEYGEIWLNGEKYPSPTELRTAQLEITNLKNALFGSVLSLETDTNTEVDKTILSDNVVVDNEVYPIIDNTRALLSEVKGETDVENDKLISSTIKGIKFYDTDGQTIMGEITLPSKQSLKGIPNGAVDKLVVTKNENDDYYTLKKVANTITITFDGTESWSVGGSSQNLMQVSISNESVVPTHCISNYLQSSTLMPNQIAEKSVRMGTNTIYIRYEEITNPDGNSSINQKTTNWKTYLAQQYANGTPLEIVYQVATPTETTLSTTLTLEEVSAMRRNGGYIEVVGNDNETYGAKPSIDLLVVCEKPSV